MFNWISEEEPRGLSPHLISAFQVLYFNQPSFFYFTFEDQSYSYPHHVFFAMQDYFNNFLNLEEG